ncbi:MAG TPA: protein adenylyltransferase SelO family protein [Gammaproteobacteria bacterium]|nr:protein adenylyltransferase SelO family protein [Gammaproteobacteria bacterium]
MGYRRFDTIDGHHPWRNVSADVYVDYAVRSRHGGRVFYFNFDLAREMGLIARRHPRRLTPGLSQAILDAFSLVIINEYDMQHGRRFPKRDVRPHKYMATRYLQCQHRSRTGRTSGDGRSIWNGFFKGPNGVWDISSCGTGATCLSPATARFGTYFKTGNLARPYAGGQADLLDSVCAALMSDIFHRNGIATERTLAIIAFDDGTCIAVRAAGNLLRPAHLFRLLKMGRLDELRAAVNYYIARQRANGDWPAPRRGQDRYRVFLERMATHFARAAAVFESEYIFCWMDWDGDNLLMDGAVLDYGSVRQFGLYHHEYRYNDIERLSTTIAEQRGKARYIVQTFAQLADYLVTGRKQSLKSFRHHAALKAFDRVFEATKDNALIHKLGYDRRQAGLIQGEPALRRDLRRLRTVLHAFERVKSTRGLYRTQDGITADAIFCVRDILRELPGHFLDTQTDMDAGQFLAVTKTDYATDEDARLTPARRDKARKFQRLYRRLLTGVARRQGASTDSVLRGMKERSDLVNRYERVTGDAVIYAADRLVREAWPLGFDAVNAVFRHFVAQQVLDPDARKGRRHHPLNSRKGRQVLRTMLRDVRTLRAGL